MADEFVGSKRRRLWNLTWE